MNNSRKIYNRKTLLWLVLFFPVGFMRMLSSACSWKKGVKFAVSGLACVLVAAVMIAPSPYPQPESGISLYNDSQDEPYDPEVPDHIVDGYVAPVVKPVVLPAEDEAENTTTYVYATEQQDNYHTGTCQFAYASGQQLTLYEAYYLGYTPGRCCDAPPYEGIL